MKNLSIPVTVLVKVLEVLEEKQFISLPDGDEKNDDDVLGVLDMLKAAMKDAGYKTPRRGNHD